MSACLQTAFYSLFLLHKKKCAILSVGFGQYFLIGQNYFSRGGEEAGRGKSREVLRKNKIWRRKWTIKIKYFLLKKILEENLIQKHLSNFIKTKINIVLDISIMVRVFANGPVDLGSIQGRVIPKIQKVVLDATLLNTQHYKVRIKGKVEQSKERSCALPYISV